MNIKINKLTLQNFKGIKFLEINADGANLTIYGDNATGKTTIFDAFTWLLFGKDSLGSSDFGIKTKDENGNVIHNLEHIVEGELAIDNSILTLRKVYMEKWTKKRGSSEAEFSGHETKFYINEVPSKKNEYEAKIASIIDETLFKIITNPLHFNENMKWQDRRGILLNLCESLDDCDIIGTNDEFLPLMDELKGRTIQEYQKVIKSKQSAINDDLKAIPQRISEARLAIPETVAEVDENAKVVIEDRIAELNNEILALKNGNGVSDAEIELKALKEKKASLNYATCDTSATRQRLLDVKMNLRQTENEVAVCTRELNNLSGCIADYTKKAEALRKEWHEVNDKQYSESELCPTCGQHLPEAQIAEAKAKFNIARANKLESITEKGKEAKAEIDRIGKLRVAIEEKMASWQSKANELSEEIKGLEASIEKANAEFNASKLKEIAEIDKAIAESEEKASHGANDVEPKIYSIREEITAERAKIAEIDKAIAERDLAERQRNRIAELEADEKRLAQEYSELDKTAFLIDKFIKFKVDLLSEEINSHFQYAKFKLFEEQINGGIAECCEVTYGGVPYADLNNAARISVGIDIINTLCKLNDKYAPVIVDNAESITNIPLTISQMICLVVSASDAFLRIEKGI